MKRIGVTGQAGFIGTHLYNTLKLSPEDYLLVDFDDEFFSVQSRLEEWVSQCDVIVHLAAVNRHDDPDEIYRTNIRLVQQLIDALDATSSRAHVLFSSSSQEENDNPYGRSKLEGRRMLRRWSEEAGATFTGLVIPNVFGPFGRPFYNSVVATFSYQLTHDLVPVIQVDREIDLIFIADLVQHIKNCMLEGTSIDSLVVPYSKRIKVSELLKLMIGYRDDYLNKGVIPELKDGFSRDLFNTIRSYANIEKQFPAKLELKSDPRGSFVETMRLGVGGQVSFSTTKPGITRGNHFHTRKIERFVVIRGIARIELRRIGEEKVYSYELNGNEPSYVDMPIWYTHNITNVGDEELLTLFWINEFFDPDDPDTYFEQV